MRRNAYAIVGCTMLLLAIGLGAVFSGSYPLASCLDRCNNDAFYFVKRQAIWAAVGVVGMLIASRLDHIHCRRLSWPLLIVSAVLLVLCFVPGIGVRINGSNRWVRFGPVTFQPSELAKLAVIIFLADYLDRWRWVVKQIQWRRLVRRELKSSDLNWGFLLPMGVVTVIGALIFCEVDVGGAALVVLVAGVMLFIGGVPSWLLLFVYGGVATAAGVFVMNNPVRAERVWRYIEQLLRGVLLDPQHQQGFWAFVRGGWFGVGPGCGIAQHFYLPLAFSDFIAPVIGEEFGFMGMLLLLAAFATFISAGAAASWRARDGFCRLLGMGIVVLIGFQALINLGVAVALLPTKGMPLPFISYGGSNLVVLLIGVGLLIGIANRAGISESKYSIEG